MSGDFEGLAAPAKRALANAGIGSLSELAKRSRAEVAALHGMGPNALTQLEAKLAAAGLAFAR